MAEEHKQSAQPPKQPAPQVVKMQPTEADNEVTALGNKIKGIADAEDSAMALVEGMREMLKKLAAGLKAEGVTDDQLVACQQLDDALVYGGLRLATSVVANTHRW